MVKIFSLNSTFGKHVHDLNDSGADCVVIDPVNAAQLVAPGLVPQNNMLNNEEFAKVGMQIKKLREQINNFLQGKNKLLLVFLRPFLALNHDHCQDLQIGNYDWLWEGAGTDQRLKIQKVPLATTNISTWGENSPLAEYLKNFNKASVAAQGEFVSLASLGNLSSAFMIPKGKSRIVFLQKNKEPKKLQEVIQRATHPENWPTPSVHKICPLWLSNYQLPVVERENKTIVVLQKTIEQVKKEAQETIAQMQKQAQEITEKLTLWKNIPQYIFSGEMEESCKGVSGILQDWNAHVVHKHPLVLATWRECKLAFLVVHCEEEATLWTGRLLVNKLEPGYKGVLVINHHRYLDLKERPAHFVSPSLVEFANQNNIALLSTVDLYRVYERDTPNFLDILVQKSGIIPRSSC